MFPREWGPWHRANPGRGLAVADPPGAAAQANTCFPNRSPDFGGARAPPGKRESSSELHFNSPSLLSRAYQSVSNSGRKVVKPLFFLKKPTRVGRRRGNYVKKSDVIGR